MPKSTLPNNQGGRSGSIARPEDSATVEQRKARAEAALHGGEFDLVEHLLEQDNIELESLVENLRIYQAELEIQNIELRDAQAASQRALDRFTQLFALQPLAELVIDRSGLLLEANTRADGLFELDDSRPHPHYLRGLVEADAQSRLAAALQRAEQDGASRVDLLRFRSVNGRVFSGELHIARLPNEADQVSQFVCAVVDLTQRIEAEARIAALAAVVDNSADIIVVKDLDLRVVAANMAFARASGHRTAAELIGKTDAEIFKVSPQQDPVRGYMADERQAQTLRPGEFLLREEPLVLADGEVRHVLTRKYPIHDAAGVLIGTGNISVDISDRKRTEELERFSAFQAGIAEMSTSVLHNVGNAITALIQEAANVEHAAGELLRIADLLEANADSESSQSRQTDPQSGPVPESSRRQVAIQREAARAIRQIIEDALRQPARRLGVGVQHIADIVRIQQGAALPTVQFSRFSLTQAIQSALELQGEKVSNLDIQVEVSVDPKAEMVTLSHNLMLQTLVNVICNSIEAIEERARGASFQGRIEICAEALTDQRLRITLTDNGIGFDPVTRDSLFRFGFSSKPRGTGFGLPSVAVFARESGGLVLLDSDGPGRGARLVLELPMQAGVVGLDQGAP